MKAYRGFKKTRHGLAQWEKLPTGEYRYVCECHPTAGGWSMPEVYASIQTGIHPRRLNDAEARLWHERLLRDAGILA